jgi:hypothetical protein
LPDREKIEIVTGHLKTIQTSADTQTMSGLKYFSYAGFGAQLSDMNHYSQSVRVGDRIETSGQGEPW